MCICVCATQQWIVRNTCQPFNEILYKLMCASWMEMVKYEIVDIFLRLNHLLKLEYLLIVAICFCIRFAYWIIFVVVVAIFEDLYYWLRLDCDSISRTYRVQRKIAFMFQKPHLHQSSYWLAIERRLKEKINLWNFKLIGGTLKHGNWISVEHLMWIDVLRTQIPLLETANRQILFFFHK